MMGLIYIVKNKLNNKVYVGQTIRRLKNRLRRHQNSVDRGSKFHFHKALRKYGWEVFNIYAIAFPEVVLNDAEKAYIQKYDSYRSGYNQTEGGHSGYKSKKPPWNKGLKGVQKAWNKGISHTEEHKKNLVKAWKKRREAK